MNEKTLKTLLIKLMDAQDTVTHLNEQGKGYSNETQNYIDIRNKIVLRILALNKAESETE